MGVDCRDGAGQAAQNRSDVLRTERHQVTASHPPPRALHIFGIYVNMTVPHERGERGTGPRLRSWGKERNVAKQRMFLASLAVVEQPNGYYQVSATTGGFQHADQRITTYPNLTWVEVGTLLGALQSQWSDDRSVHGAVSVPSPWEQLSLID